MRYELHLVYLVKKTSYLLLFHGAQIPDKPKKGIFQSLEDNPWSNTHHTNQPQVPMPCFNYELLGWHTLIPQYSVLHFFFFNRPNLSSQLILHTWKNKANRLKSSRHELFKIGTDIYFSPEHLISFTVGFSPPASQWIFKTLCVYAAPPLLRWSLILRMSPIINSTPAVGNCFHCMYWMPPPTCTYYWENKDGMHA